MVRWVLLQVVLELVMRPLRALGQNARALFGMALALTPNPMVSGHMPVAQR